MSLDGDREDARMVTHLPVFVLLVKWNFPGLFVLIARQNFRDHPWVGKTQEQQKDLNCDVE